MNETILILAIIVVAVVFLTTRTEGFGFPFGSLTRTPMSPTVEPRYSQPYCVDNSGQPVPCKVPCQYSCPSCEYDYPVPVFGPNIGAYSPNKWCPGPPVC